MNQEKIGEFIKNIRVKNKLTQEAFADSLHVTAQAVSKWELGKSIPDISILNDISKKYNINIDELLNGKKKRKNILIMTVFGALLIAGAIIFIILHNKDSYMIRDVTSKCEEYKITGIAAYDSKKSTIYISNVEYCGKDDLSKKYETISCTLYETYDDITKKISTCEEKSDITLNDYLKSISIKVLDYVSVCKDFDASTLYLEIVAEGESNYQHKIPLKITTCN